MYEINKDLLREKRKLTKEEREKIIESFKEVTDSDYFLALLAHLRENEFSAYVPDLHNAFYELKKRFPQHFSNLRFTTNENYPFCRRIEQIFFWMMQYRAIYMIAPDLRTYVMTNETKAIVLRDIFPKLNADFKEDLTEMVRVLSEYIIKK